MRVSCVWLVGALLLGASQAANWVQVSGEERQSTTTTTRSPFTARFGAALVAVEAPDPEPGETVSITEQRRFFLLGGDDYDERGPFGQLHNDVWLASEPELSATESLVDRTHYGSRMPRITAQVQWIQRAGDRTPPVGVNYREYLCCLSNVPWECESTSCEPIDPYEGQRRWSPRRFHQALALPDGRLLVMGGRARALEDIPGGYDPVLGDQSGINEFEGGVVGARERWREKARLMNDVWSSSDGGATWTLMNVGCGVNNMAQTRPPGSKVQRCNRDSDCQARRLGSVQCEEGACVCRHWSPRERFQAEYFDDRVWVMGGLAYTEAHTCGVIGSCGEGNSVYLNDVWVSGNLGRSWTEVALQADWPPRADFGATVSGGYLWLMAGRGGHTGKYKDNPLYNDVWRSSDGAAWELVPPPSAEWHWSPRTSASVEALDGRLYVMGGMDLVPPPPKDRDLNAVELVAKAAAEAPVLLLVEPEVDAEEEEAQVGEDMSSIRLKPLREVWSWNWTQDGASWEVDFGPPSRQFGYFSANDSAFERFNLSMPQAAHLAEHGIFTVYQLANIDPAVVRNLRTTPKQEQRFQPTVMPSGEERSLCFYKQFAAHLIDRCTLRKRQYDGQFMEDLVVIEGNGAVFDVDTDPPDDGCLDELNAYHFSESDTDVVCRSTPNARFHMSSSVLNGKLYLLGGTQGGVAPAEDLWYRDPDIPRTLISTAPRSRSSDTVFGFTCSEAPCMFEYRVFEVDRDIKVHFQGHGRMVRNWTRTLSPLDLSSFIYRGWFRLEARAVDPAGNRDMAMLPNVTTYVWRYIPPLPIVAIILALLLLIVLLSVGIYSYRRYLRRKQLERYAMKRIQRKIRAVQDGDWTTFHKKKKKKKKKKKGRKQKDRDKRKKVSAIKRAKAEAKRKMKSKEKSRANADKKAKKKGGKGKKKKKKR